MTPSTPTIEVADGSDTRWALETARTLWAQGERRDALQWVRRAAEAAAEAGDDDRALALAKMGAELRTAIDMPRTLPPPPPVDIPPPSMRGDAELVVTVVATNGSIPAPDAALVAHRAIRVAVLPGGTPPELRVVVLAPGQMAPKDSVVSLLVALQPGSSPLP